MTFVDHAARDTLRKGLESTLRDGGGNRQDREGSAMTFVDQAARDAIRKDLESTLVVEAVADTSKVARVRQ